MTTVEDLYRAHARHVLAYALRRSDNATARLRVIGFPHAAGNALFYRSWRTYMPRDIDFCPIELPGHGQRIGEMAVTHLDTLVPTLQAVLEPLLTIPFAFFGHSTGACIAFEAARVLRAIDGRSATHLFVSGRPAPGRARTGIRSSVIDARRIVVSEPSSWSGVTSAGIAPRSRSTAVRSLPAASGVLMKRMLPSPICHFKSRHGPVISLAT